MSAQQGNRWRIGRGAIPVASLIILACLFSLSWFTFDRVNKVFQAKDWVGHTEEVRAALQGAYGLIATAESDHRAYLLTLDKGSKERYLGSRAKVDALLERVDSLTKDNSKQQTLLDNLELSVAARYTYMGSSLSERETYGLERTIDILKLGEGLSAMNAIRSAIEEMMAEEERLLADRKIESEQQVIHAEVAFGLTLSISAALISAFALFSSRLIGLREAAANEERALRNKIEREVLRTKAAEAQLERTMLELRRSNEELQNFAFVASHDLQEPLRKIRAFSDRVRRRAGDALDTESKDSLQRVEAAADRMQRLILDLLDLSRITTKGRPHIKVSLAQTVEEVADDLQTRLEETEGNVIHGSLPTVVVDPAQLRQLFQNLIANALKFRRAGVAPEIRIEAETRPDGRVAIRVSDNGIGFESKYEDRIFIVFQRLHGRGEYEGSGIGLAIVRKIVERHGGSIEAKGRPGEGATFEFDLPGETSARQTDATLDAGEAE